MKICRTCKKEKPLLEFQAYKTTKKNSKYYPDCKSCTSLSNKNKQAVTRGGIIYMPSGMQYVNNIIGKETCRASKY